jgi:hypothetical protein
MDINNVLYIITFLAIFVYLLQINNVVYYLIFTSMIVVLYMVSKDLRISISVSGVTTALIYIFLDKQPLKKRKSMLNIEHYSSKKASKKKETKEQKDDEEEEFEPIVNNKIDTKSSFMETLKSLNPTEVSGLKKETVELMQTQKQLIETLQSMGPALKEGKTILDTFKNYFNDSSLEKLSI